MTSTGKLILVLGFGRYFNAFWNVYDCTNLGVPIGTIFCWWLIYTRSPLVDDGRQRRHSTGTRTPGVFGPDSDCWRISQRSYCYVVLAAAVSLPTRLRSRPRVRVAVESARRLRSVRRAVWRCPTPVCTCCASTATRPQLAVRS